MRGFYSPAPVPREQMALLRQCRIRFEELFPGECSMTFLMDMQAMVEHGLIDLALLAGAPDADFGHDAWGCRRHIDTETGHLAGGFLPRCHPRATPEKKEVAR